MNVIHTEFAPKAVGPYSQGVEHNGIFYFSGQIGLIPTTGELASDFDQQLDQTMNNISALLKHCNLTPKNVIKTTIFVTDMANFAKVNAKYETFFTAPYPARSTVQVTALPKGAVVEIEVIASR